MLPGSTYLVTRRCTQQQFLLTPSKQVSLAFLYCLAMAQQSTNMLIHVVCVMSNHYHLVVTDPERRLPAFTRMLNMMMAKCMNAHYGRSENFWNPAQPNYVLLAGDEAILEKAAYSITNPVEAGLVPSSRDWPGLVISTPGVYEAERPEWFSRKRKKTLRLEITALPLQSGEPEKEVVKRLEQLVAEREKAFRKQLKNEQRRFLGKDAILRQSPFDSPNSASSNKTSKPKSKITPHVATKDKTLRIKILRRLKAFYEAYKQARDRFSKGEWSVVFPAGTYKLRIQAAVRCADH